MYRELLQIPRTSSNKGDELLSVEWKNIASEVNSILVLLLVFAALTAIWNLTRHSKILQHVILNLRS